jgi:hypothetical protein
MNCPYRKGLVRFEALLKENAIAGLMANNWPKIRRGQGGQGGLAADLRRTCGGLAADLRGPQVYYLFSKPYFRAHFDC